MIKIHRGKSAARRPLGDISNGGNALRSRKTTSAKEGDDGAALERLLRVRSDLSSLIGQIDGLISQAIENKTISKKASQDIDSLRNILSDMHVSLKPWFSRLRQSFDPSSTAPKNQLCQSLDTDPVSSAMGDRETAAINRNEPELELIVSPSPLVSWRAGTCTVDCGRQLFLLTPLPKNKACLSKCPRSSKSMIRIVMDKEQSNHKLPASSVSGSNACDDLLGGVSMEEKLAPTNVSKPSSFEQTSGRLETGYVSPSSFLNDNDGTNDMSLLTPSLPRGSGLLDPIFEPHQQDGEVSELAEHNINNNDAEVSDDLSDESSDNLATKYQELFGLQPAPRFTSRRKEVDETLNWFLSPPKTCVLLEPSDEKSLPTPNNGLSLATPIWKDLESTQKGKLPGETTLKRELWTKFEAASSNQLHLDVSVLQRTGRKGFLDMLEEVSE